MLKLAILAGTIGLLLLWNSSAVSHQWILLGSYFQSRWDNYLALVGTDTLTHHFYIPFLMSNVLYFTLATFFTFMDLTQKPSFLRKYKIQPGSNEPLEPSRLRSLIAVTVFNQTVVNYLCGYAMVMFQGKVLRNLPDLATLPSASTVVFQLFLFMIVKETGFFYSHWLLHHRLFYQRIHKRHHEWSDTIALVASYAHPLEHVVSGVLPTLLGPCLIGSHVVVQMIGIVIATPMALINHCGYHLPFLPSNEFHDFHHHKFNQNFGSSLPVFDWLHGTDLIFRSNAAYKRHRVLFTTDSARELYPDGEGERKEF